MKLLLVVLVVGAVSAAPNNLGLSEIFNAYKGVGPVLLGGDQDRTENKAQQLLGQDDHDYLAAQWAEFKSKYSKTYDGYGEQNEEYRFGVFKTNMAKVKLLQETELGTATYGATFFADLTEDEYKKYVMPTKYFAQGHDLPYAEIPSDPAPESYDWREKGAVTKVKNQGSCGSCWAFSTTGNIEGQWFLKKGKLVSLSEQELVSCDKVDHGCEGGLPSQAYKQIMKLGGLDTETDYPYDGIDEKCSLKSNPAAYINSSVAISQDEAQMAAWLAKNGPISIGINANAMQFYFGGISHPFSFLCDPSNLDHGVLIVGYGTESGKPYWIIKNSWGETWGEKGYYRVYRGDGVCGLNRMCTSAVVN